MYRRLLAPFTTVACFKQKTAVPFLTQNRKACLILLYTSSEVTIRKEIVDRLLKQCGQCIVAPETGIDATDVGQPLIVAVPLMPEREFDALRRTWT